MREDSKCDVIVNNMTETFNVDIVHARTKHLIDILEDIRMDLIKRIMVKRSIRQASEDDIYPKIQIGLSRPKRNRMKDPCEDPKKVGILT